LNSRPLPYQGSALPLSYCSEKPDSSAVTVPQAPERCKSLFSCSARAVNRSCRVEDYDEFGTARRE